MQVRAHKRNFYEFLVDLFDKNAQISGAVITTLPQTRATDDWNNLSAESDRIPIGATLITQTRITFH